MPRAVGIDLGTTNSCVAVVEGSEVRVLPSAEGGRTTPSVVAVQAGGDVLVGARAKQLALADPASAVFSAKRFIGRKGNDPDVELSRRLVPYAVTSAPNGDAHLVLGGRPCSPTEISALVLRKLKQDAERALEDTVDEAVITVPAYFNYAQRQATRDAGSLAGLDVIRILNEPTAAALASGLDPAQDAKIAVFDLGGGTFDVSILEVSRGIFEVRATNGNTYLGGDDFNFRIVEYLREAIRKRHGVDVQEESQAYQRLIDASERAKCALSEATETVIDLPMLIEHDGARLDVTETLTRATLEALTAPLVSATLDPCRAALEDAGIPPKDVTHVVLVGGQTRMPAVRRAVAIFFGRDPYLGADPDEAVARGAARQAAILRGGRRDVLLLDVTANSLGVRGAGGVFERVIQRNTTVPVRASRAFTTVEEGQRVVTIEVLQGEYDEADKNVSLESVDLGGLPRRAAGEVRVEVAFDVDASGILKVSAKVAGSDDAPSLVLRPSTGLDDREFAEIAARLSGLTVHGRSAPKAKPKRKVTAPPAGPSGAFVPSAPGPDDTGSSPGRPSLTSPPVKKAKNPLPPGTHGPDLFAPGAASERSGRLEDAMLTDVVQGLPAAGWLQVETDTASARLYVKKGKTVFAATSDASGLDAVYETMTWDRGAWRFSPDGKAPTANV